MDYLLVSLLIGSNVYWAFHCHKLMNKLMSRSYFEYMQAEQLKTPEVQRPPKVDHEYIDPVDNEQADQANALFGIN